MERLSAWACVLMLAVAVAHRGGLAAEPPVSVDPPWGFIAPSTCPSIDGYDLLVGAQHGGDEIGQQLGPNGEDLEFLDPTLMQLTAANCSSNPDCQAFDAWGYLKSAINPMIQEYNCLWVKQMDTPLTYCPLIDNYITYLDTDHEGNTTDTLTGQSDINELVKMLAAKCSDDWLGCNGFNTGGQLKSTLLPTQASPGMCLYSKKETTLCPEVAGYSMIDEADHLGDDLVNVGYSSYVEQTVYKAASACSNEPACTGFNSDGWLKSVANALVDVQGVCIYMKEAAPSPAPTPSPSAGHGGSSPGGGYYVGGYYGYYMP